MKNIAKGTAHLLSRNILSTAAVIALIGASAFAAAPTGGYQPGATLDPDCTPGDTDCVVQGGDMTDDTWSMSGGNVVVQNGNVGIGTDLPYGSLHVAGLYRYVKVEGSTSDYGIAYCSVDVDINAAEASFPPTEPLGTECTDRDLDHSTSKYNKLVVADKYYTTLDYTTTQPSVPQCSWDTDNSAAEPSPIPNISDIGYECWDQRGSYYYHRKAILVKENNNFIVANNGNISINKGPNIIDAHALNVGGNISAQNYSPQLILQRSVDYGGYVQGIQTKLKDGTNNWFIGNQGESTFMISKGNYVGKVVVVKSDGNVGIGTTSPTNPLHVKGSSGPLFERSANGIVGNFNSDANNALLVVSSDNDGITGLDTGPMSNTDAFRFRFDANTLDGSIYNDSNNAINIGTLGNTNTMTIENGNIGIGRTSPTVKLDVKGTVRINNETDYSHLRLGQESNDAIIADNTSAGTYGGGYWFRVHDELAPYKYRDVMMLADDGTVGVGTRISESNSVAGTLDMTEVDGSVVNTEMRVGTEGGAAVSNGTSIIRLSNYGSQDNNGGGSVMFSNTRFGSTVGNSDLAAIKGSRETYNKGNLKFYTSEGTGNTEKMRIASSGNVGIGTTAPGDTLTIEGDGTNGITIRGESASLGLRGPTMHSILGANASKIIAPTNRSLAVEIKGNDATDRFSIVTDPSNGSIADTESFVVLNNGNTGIGTNYPKSDFQVNINDTTNGILFMENTNTMIPTIVGVSNDGNSSAPLRIAGTRLELTGQSANANPAIEINTSNQVHLKSMASTYSGGSAHLCIADSGLIFASEAPCP